MSRQSHRNKPYNPPLTLNPRPSFTAPPNLRLLLQTPDVTSRCASPVVHSRTAGRAAGSPEPYSLNSQPSTLKPKMETTIVYWGYIGIMEKKMETIQYIGVILEALVKNQVYIGGLRKGSLVLPFCTKLQLLI